MKSTYVLLICALTFTFGCHKEEKQLLNRADDVIPGSWHIETVGLPGYGLGITYEGNTFYHDTVLFDIGTIEIDEFDIEDLDLQIPNPPPVPCLVTLKDETFQYRINRFFLSGKEVFSNFSSSAVGINIIDTPGEEFLSSSNIFANNYYVVIIDDDHLRLEKGNNRDGHFIVLTRI